MGKGKLTSYIIHYTSDIIRYRLRYFSLDYELNEFHELLTPKKLKIMKTLFENNDFILKSTGHDYDFVGIIETKTEEPLTFFFGETVADGIGDVDDYESDVDETKTELLDVYQGMKEYDHETGDPDDDEEQETAMSYLAANDYDHVSFFRTRDDRSTGFLSNPQERGQFLAIIKNYCPEQLSQIAWA